LLVALVLLLAFSVVCTKPAPLPQAPQPPDYIVVAPDGLSILVLPDPVIGRQVTVRPDGMISVDLVGDIQAGGRTPMEIAAAVQESISRFKRDAVVNVTVVSSPSQFVTIYGEVARPGVFPLDSETRVSEAIGRVGGTRPFANLDGVRLIRATGSGTQVITIDLAAISEGDLSTNFVVQQGDLIVVPPTILAKIGYAMQMVLFPIQPFLSGAALAGAIYSGASGIARGTN